MWHGRWVDGGGEEWLLEDLTGVNVLEGGKLLTNLGFMDLYHFPSEHDIDTSLPALVEGNLVGIAELEDLLVWGPVLDFGAGTGSSLELILSHEGLVVEGVEVAAFSLVWGEWRIVDHISGGVAPTVIVVLLNGFLGVKHVDVDSLGLVGFSQLWESLDKVWSVIETWGEDESLVAVLLTSAELDLVLVREEFGNLGSNVSSAPWINLGRNSSGLQLKWCNMLVADTEVSVWLNELRVAGDKGHLVINVIGLNKLGDCSSISSTNKNNIEFSLSSWHVWLLFSTSHASGWDGNEAGLHLSRGIGSGGN